METNCPACQREFNLQPATCPKCGYPFEGSALARARHIERFVRKQAPPPDRPRLFKYPRLLLYAVAVFGALYNFYQYRQGGMAPGDLALNFGLVAAYAVCARNLPRNPLLFGASPLVLFILINALHFFIDPDRIYNDLWIKLLVVSCLLLALRGVVQVLREKGELGVE